MKKGLFTLAIIFTFGLLSTSCKTPEKKEHNKEHVHAEKTLYQCPMKCEEDKTYEKAGNCPVCKMKLQKKAHDKEHVHAEKEVYQCPMNCEEDKTYEKEGNCPVCKMKLRKKVDENHEESHH